MPSAEERLVGNWEVTPERNGVSAEMGESEAPEVPENVQAQLRQRAEQEGGPVSASALVLFSHDLTTRETDTRVSLPKPAASSRDVGCVGCGGRAESKVPEGIRRDAGPAATVPREQAAWGRAQT